MYSQLCCVLLKELFSQHKPAANIVVNSRKTTLSMTTGPRLLLLLRNCPTNFWLKMFEGLNEAQKKKGEGYVVQTD